MRQATGKNESKTTKVKTESDPAVGEPTDGPEAQQRREKMQHQEKAEGDRRSDAGRR